MDVNEGKLNGGSGGGGSNGSGRGHRGGRRGGDVSSSGRTGSSGDEDEDVDEDEDDAYQLSADFCARGTFSRVSPTIPSSGETITRVAGRWVHYYYDLHRYSLPSPDATFTFFNNCIVDESKCSKSLPPARLRSIRFAFKEGRICKCVWHWNHTALLLG